MSVEENNTVEVKQTCSQRMWKLLREQAQLQKDTSMNFDTMDGKTDVVEAFKQLSVNTNTMKENSMRLSEIIIDSIITKSELDILSILYHQILFVSTKSTIAGFGNLVKIAFDADMLSKEEVQNLL